MAIDPAVLRAMLSAGCTAEQIVAVAEAAAASDAERTAERRERDRVRKRRQRENGKANENNGRVRVTSRNPRDVQDNPSPLDPPLSLSPTPPNQNPPYNPPNLELSLPSEAPPSAAPDDLDEALAAYNSAADAAGWPQARNLSKARRSSLKARLRECGGVQGWADAMARARASPFLTGGNSRDWLPSLDFFLQAKSFTKLLEGAYDRRDSPARPSTAAQGASGPSQRIAAMADLVAERHERRLQANNPGGFSPDGWPEADGGNDGSPSGCALAASYR